MCSFRGREHHRQCDNANPDRQHHSRVGIRLDHHTPARRRHSRLEPALGQLQGWVWVNLQQLLARSGKYAPSNHLTALPTVADTLVFHSLPNQSSSYDQLTPVLLATRATKHM